jgi:hypothetical protein
MLVQTIFMVISLHKIIYWTELRLFRVMLRKSTSAETVIVMRNGFFLTKLRNGVVEHATHKHDGLPSVYFC